MPQDNVNQRLIEAIKKYYVIELLFGEGLYVGGEHIRSEVEPIFLALIENGLDLTISVRDFPLIVLAAGTGLDACICALLENGADVNAIDYDRRTAMHFAVGNCRMETIKMMVHRGAELNALDDEGLPPLNSLGDDERRDVVSFPRSKGAKKLTRISRNIERLM